MKKYIIYLKDDTEQSVYASNFQEALKLLKLSENDVEDYTSVDVYDEELEMA